MKPSIEPDHTLWQLIESNRLGLNAIRLLLAMLVLFSHTFPLMLGLPDPKWPNFGISTSYGGFAVSAFFSLSGLLVVNSAIKSNFAYFIKSRFFRIMPAFVASLFIAAFIFGPVLYFDENKNLNGYFNFSPNGPFSYFMKNFFLPIGLQFHIHDLLQSVPHPSAINGSLWTLPIEVRAYLVAAFIGALCKFFDSRIILTISVALINFYIFFSVTEPQLAFHIFPAWITASPYYLSNFLIGGLFAVLAKYIKVRSIYTLIPVVIFISSEFIGGVFFLSIGLGCLAIVLPLCSEIFRLSKISFFSQDISYGVYVYAFPIQQLVVYFFPGKNLITYLCLASIPTLVLSWLSWRFIESRALKIGKKLAIT